MTVVLIKISLIKDDWSFASNFTTPSWLGGTVCKNEHHQQKNFSKGILICLIEFYTEIKSDFNANCKECVGAFHSVIEC